MTSDQQLFARGLATYRKVITANYMAHEQVYSVLHEILLNEAKGGFVFADLACGTAPLSAVALSGTTGGKGRQRLTRVLNATNSLELFPTDE